LTSGGSTASEDRLRAVLLKVVKKYVLPTNPQEAGELLGEFYPTWTPEPNDSLDDLRLGGEGEEGDEAEADEIRPLDEAKGIEASSQ
jgi:hypothetical protein